MTPLLLRNSLLGALIAAGLFLCLFAAARLFQVLCQPGPETARKFFHLGGSLVALCLPWLFDAVWAAFAVVGGGALILAAVRWVPALRGSWGRILGSVGRTTFGEFWFVAAILCLLLFAGRSLLLYSIPLLVLAVGDTSAALVGGLRGRRHYSTTSGSRKSVEGSMTFFLASFLAVLVPLIIGIPTEWRMSLPRALLIGAAATIIEGASTGGMDNFLVPVACVALLRLSSRGTPLALALGAAMTLGAGFLFLAWQRRRERRRGAMPRTRPGAGRAQNNVVSFLERQVHERAPAPALWTTDRGTMTFEDLGRLVSAAHARLAAARIAPGDTVLLALLPGVSLYAWGAAILAAGATVLAVDPWVRADRLAALLEEVQPKAMIFDGPGFLWGAAHRAVGRIQHRMYSSLAPARDADFPVEEVPSSAPAVVTFTAGSTGRPKGVVRTHRLLSTTRDILSRRTDGDRQGGPDLCIFPGLAMLNIAFGRTSLLVSPWQRSLAFLDALPAELAPQTMTVGPRFFERVLRQCRLSALRHVVLGGAPADCTTVEAGLRRYPEARIDWLYGCTEAEPICVAAAGEALKASRCCGLAQVLWVGRPIPEIRIEPSPEGLWICGPHVSGSYLASPEDNARFKRTDPNGVTWHNTGDRLLENPPWARVSARSAAVREATGRKGADYGDAGGLWFAGRVSQPLGEFWAEQRLYTAIGHSHAFVLRDGGGSLTAYGEGIERHAVVIRAAVPQVRLIRDVGKVSWDPRHRSRIRRELGRRRA